ncbi:MAG: prepilin-type N-terminal cleavage/methylation domain-containing protein [Candidatus Xenobiia bacterium LiM19]
MKRGFSLIEVMVALALLCVAFMFLLSCVPLVASGIKSSENLKNATIVGNNIMERMRNTTFSQLKSVMKSGESCISGATNGVAYSSQYLYDTTVSPVPEDSGEQSMENIVVTVTWKEKGKDKSIKFQTIVYNKEK